MQQQGDSFRALKMLHIALLLGLILFTVIVLVMLRLSPAAPHDESFERTLQAVNAVASMAALLIGFNLFKRRLSAIRHEQTEAVRKMERYRTACITWWALIEGPGILAIIGLYLSSNYVFLALALFHIALLFMFMPRKENIIVLLNLSSEDVMRLEGKTG